MKRDEIPGVWIDAPLGEVGQARPHDSAHLHVAGRATYIDDIAEPIGTLHAAVGMSAIARGRIKSIDLGPVRAAPGVVLVLTEDDIPGQKVIGPVQHDEPVFTRDRVEFLGQPLFAVIAESMDAARRAAKLAKVEYIAEKPILDYDEALAAESYVLPPMHLTCGDARAALEKAPHRLKNRLTIGGQEQFYLESQIAFAIPLEDGQVRVYSSTQHPTEVQFTVAHVLDVPPTMVTVECRRMGGGFGGKETQGAHFAVVAALAATKLKRAVKFRPDRDDDMMLTGKRHDFRFDYEVGYDDTGRISALECVMASRCGWSADLSHSVNDRAMTHGSNAYYLPNVSITSYRLKTNMQSANAFRGFGGPQGLMMIENVIDDIARALGRDPLAVRMANFYDKDPASPRTVTPYGMKVEDNVINELVADLVAQSDYKKRRAEIHEWNAGQSVIKRGIGLTPVMFGISFTATFMNQAGALVHVYQDGSVSVNHGGTEMGQGVYTKVAQVVAHEFGLPLSQIRITATDTSKVPNTSPTAASSGADINGKAAQNAAHNLKQRMAAFCASAYGVAEAEVRFISQEVVAGEWRMPWAELVRAAYFARVQLSATGFYATPKVGYDTKTLQGRMFYYFSYGAAVSEVAIDTLTGEMKVLRVDALHDVGKSLNPALDRGQIEGGFVQGMGWLTSEELVWDAQGRLRTHAPSTYKIPVASDVPKAFNLQIWEPGENVEDSIYKSKAVGEPPLMLAISVFHAVRDAVAAAGDYRTTPLLDSPTTPERILNAVNAVRGHTAPEQA
ncbi:MAG TPA: xanthine dehydrogenase molybdopterin binding subunit [Burkholderiales bacterium]|nr:xanthine dehydrogenase molybdopterin binding subunit [Burkholderiales bacterium]